MVMIEPMRRSILWRPLPHSQRGRSRKPASSRPVSAITAATSCGPRPRRGGGVLAVLTVRNGPRTASGTASPDPHTMECLHCALDAPPLRSGDQEAELDPGTPQ
jgi:hypothetical protein